MNNPMLQLDINTTDFPQGTNVTQTITDVTIQWDTETGKEEMMAQADDLGQAFNLAEKYMDNEAVWQVGEIISDRTITNFTYEAWSDACDEANILFFNANGDEVARTDIDCVEVNEDYREFNGNIDVFVYLEAKSVQFGSYSAAHYLTRLTVTTDAPPESNASIDVLPEDNGGGAGSAGALVLIILGAVLVRKLL